jgi:hypothetical protein
MGTASDFLALDFMATPGGEQDPQPGGQGEHLDLHHGGNPFSGGFEVLDAAVVHVGDAVREFEDAGVVGDDDQGALAIHGQALQDFHHPVPRLMVQGGGGLVADDQLRVVHQGPGHGDPLLLAARDLAREGVSLVAQAHLLQASPGLGQGLVLPLPQMSRGIATFSATVSVGIRLKDWNTKPMFLPR